MRTKRSYYFMAVVAIPLLMALRNPSINESLHNASLTALKPAFVVTQSISGTISDGYEIVVQFWRTFLTQGSLEARVQELEAELSELKEVSKENERLSELLEFKETLKTEPIAARVIGWDPTPWRKTLILDKGSVHGIEKNMVVVVREGLIGRVFEVGSQTSRVLLITDQDSRVSSMTSDNRAHGVIAGKGTRRLVMTYLDLESGVKIDEEVMSSGMGRFYSKGLRIGQITGIQRSGDGLHLEAHIQPHINFSKLEEVLCFVSSQAG